MGFVFAVEVEITFNSLFERFFPFLIMSALIIIIKNTADTANESLKILSNI